VDIWERDAWTGQIVGYVTSSTAARRRRQQPEEPTTTAGTTAPLNYYTASDLSVYEKEAYFCATMVREGMVPFEMNDDIQDMARIEDYDFEEAEFEMALIQSFMKLALQAQHHHHHQQQQPENSSASKAAFPPLPKAQVLVSPQPTAGQLPLLAPHVREYVSVDVETHEGAVKDAVRWWHGQEKPFQLQMAPVRDGGGGGKIKAEQIHALAQAPGGGPNNNSTLWKNNPAIDKNNNNSSTDDIAMMAALQVAMDYGNRLVSFHHEQRQ